MASVNVSDQQSHKTVLSEEYPQLGIGFSWIYSIAALWLVAGAHIDGWAHNNLPESLETFFTPWHGVLYSGFAATALVLMTKVYLNMKNGYDLKHALPNGMFLSFVGIFVFGLGGVGDMIWHETLGIEADIEALYSPTHLMLGVGGTMLASGILLHYLRNPDTLSEMNFSSRIPFYLSGALFISMLSFFTQFAVPAHTLIAGGKQFFHAEASDITVTGIGVAGSIIYAAFLVGFTLKSIDKFPHTVGQFSIILFIHGIFSTIMRFPLSNSMENPVVDGEYVVRFLIPLITLITGFYIDSIISRVSNHQAKIILSVTIGPLYYILFFALVIGVMGTLWSVHLWSGIIVVSGIAGYLLLLLSE